MTKPYPKPFHKTVSSKALGVELSEHFWSNRPWKKCSFWRNHNSDTLLSKHTRIGVWIFFDWKSQVGFAFFMQTLLVSACISNSTRHDKTLVCRGLTTVWSVFHPLKDFSHLFFPNFMYRCFGRFVASWSQYSNLVAMWTKRGVKQSKTVGTNRAHAYCVRLLYSEILSSSNAATLDDHFQSNYVPAMIGPSSECSSAVDEYNIYFYCLFFKTVEVFHTVFCCREKRFTISEAKCQ